MRRRRATGAAAPILPPAPPIGRGLGVLGLVFILLFGAVGAGATWWQVAQADALGADPLDPLRLAAARAVTRGRILAADGTVLAAGGGTVRRRYPLDAAAPVTGYRSLLLGAAGLEATWDAQLAGLAEPGATGTLLRKLRAAPWEPLDVVTSIAADLQRLGAALLAGRRGAIVLLEPATGRILALVSGPTLDAPRLSGVATGRRYLDELRAATDGALLVRPTQGLYVPGSVFKVVTAAAALESGAIDAGTTFAGQPRQSREGLVIDGVRIRDAVRDVQLGSPLTLAEAMEVSSNVWFARAALATGAEALAATAARLGIGSAPAFELPAAGGRLNDGTGLLAGFSGRVELAGAGFGQAQVLVSPLQMARIGAAIANGGELVRPRLTDRLVAPDGRTWEIGARSDGRV
ncbi:MAG: penicillin-binding transpeptidase domain-containing protein, partial [Chloroflexota bacterium]